MFYEETQLFPSFIHLKVLPLKRVILSYFKTCRQIVKILNKAENFAKSNGLNFVIVPPATTSKIPRTAIGANWSLSVSTSQTPNKYLNST